MPIEIATVPPRFISVAVEGGELPEAALRGVSELASFEVPLRS